MLSIWNINTNTLEHKKLLYLHYPFDYGQKIETGTTDKSQAPDLDFGLSVSVLVNKDELSATVL